jgi:hypothetical protein
VVCVRTEPGRRTRQQDRAGGAETDGGGAAKRARRRGACSGRVSFRGDGDPSLTAVWCIYQLSLQPPHHAGRDRHGRRAKTVLPICTTLLPSPACTGGSDQRLTSKAAGCTQVTPLIKAVQQGSEDVVRTLVQWRPRPPGLNTDPLDANAQVSPCTISPTHPPTHTPTHANRACKRAFHIARDCSHAPYSALPPMSKSADHSR